MNSKFLFLTICTWCMLFVAACMQTPFSNLVYDPCKTDVICITMTPTIDAPEAISTPSPATFTVGEALVQTDLGWKSFSSDTEYGVIMSANGNTLTITSPTETITILANTGTMDVTVNGVLVQSTPYTNLTTMSVNMHVWNRVFRFTGTEWQRNGDHMAGS